MNTFISIQVKERVHLVPGPDSLCPEEPAIPSHLFFLELSGQQECLTARQVCSLESASRAIPYSFVVVFSQKQDPDAPPQEALTCPIEDHLKELLPSLTIGRENLLNYLSETPLWSFVESGFLNQSSNSYIRDPAKAKIARDALRLAIMWKQGGLFLQLGNTVVLRPLHCLTDSNIGLSSSPNQGVDDRILGFDNGHSFLWFLMDRMVEDPSIRLTKAIQDFCEHEDQLKVGTLSCWNEIELHFRPSWAFYPDVQSQNASWETLKESFLVQVDHIKNEKEVAPKSFYGLLAREYCPTTYKLALEHGGF